MFRRAADGWKREADVEAEGAFQLGTSLALEGDTILVGAMYDGPEGTGAAYVFTRQGAAWSLPVKLSAIDKAPKAYFGSAVGLSGSTAVVTASGERHAAYVFERQGEKWTPRQKLAQSDHDDSGFGASVAIDGERIAVGAWLAAGPVAPDTGRPRPQQGAVHVYARQAAGWKEEAKLVAEDGISHGHLGESVAMSGDTIVAGAGQAMPDTSAVYVFVREGGAWKQHAKLSPPEGAGAYFGSAVGIHRDTIVVGAKFAGGGAGAAFVYQRDGATWKRKETLLSRDTGANDWLGHAVAVSADTIALGAMPKDKGAGAAYVRDRR